ncbi:hypothetical protein GQ43DRAFT_474240 [Delitschia confertaspora ATCC 74209]|uniref:Uncharacterized protein n=1 Tax=Delitschia confertaspora ATCC 74209 TaxID=1513339 RepID=A0A9P4JG13_9PLEO|nr:hypothetical protein GQ43DRAFT_474240 [Delitschia confertaspora ATCC 74209]
MAQESGITPKSDYECYIYVHNKSDVDFRLWDKSVKQGEWAPKMPPPTIEAGTEELVRLNDKNGTTEGSEGKVIYELNHPKHGDKSIKVTIEFADPTGWGENYLHANTTHPNLVSCDVRNYQRKGHPFTGHVDIYLLNADGQKAEIGTFKDSRAQSSGLISARPTDRKMLDTHLNMTKEPCITPQSGFECFIYFHNKTNVDLHLSSAKAEVGKFADKSPPRIIGAHTKGSLELKDGGGWFEGSKGWVIYKLSRHGKTISLQVNFEDPVNGENSLAVTVSHPDLVECYAMGYERKGHPFSGNIIVEFLDEMTTDNKSDQNKAIQAPEAQPRNVALAVPSERNLHARFEIGFDGKLPLGLGRKEPIHEDIAIASFIGCRVPKFRFPRGTDYNSLDRNQWEYIRGLEWNDDPSCLLFVDSDESNSALGKGLDFAHAFLFGDDGCLTRRTHFGDLQFLHSMASRYGEDANITKEKLLKWIEIMYKLATGDQGVNAKDRIGDRERFPEYFSSSTDPCGDKTLEDLLLGTTRKYPRSNIPKRALGSCLHLIQDSYAVGHTLRRLQNVWDIEGKDEDGYFRFRPNTYAQLGPIITFHTYKDQSDRHKHYDESNQDRDPKDLNSFNHIIGARCAIDKSKKLIDFYATKTKWEDGVSDFLANEVFALDKKVTRSNAEVDERFALPETSGTVCVQQAYHDDDETYRMGLERKMALLEGGLAYMQPAGVDDRAHGISRLCRGFYPAVLATLKYIMMSVGILVLFVLAIFIMRTLKLG